MNYFPLFQTLWKHSLSAGHLLRVGLYKKCIVFISAVVSIQRKENRSVSAIAPLCYGGATQCIFNKAMQKLIFKC